MFCYKVIQKEFFILVSCLVMMTACSIVGDQPSQPVAPAEKKDFLSEEITNEPVYSPSASGEPSIPASSETPVDGWVTEQPTRVISPTTACNSQGLPIFPALIQINTPGWSSRFVSPLVVSARVYPGEGGEVLIQLLREDGLLLHEKKMILHEAGDEWVDIAEIVPFEVKSAGERAYLLISTRDDYGRRLAQAGVPVVLMQIGENEIEASGFLKQPFLISQPESNDVSTKGVVHVEGYVHLFGTKRIVGELVTQTGGIMKSVVVYLRAQNSDQEYIPFSMDIPYDIEIRTPVRLTLRQADENNLNVDVILQSIPIYLDPW